jgi:hypothetical protein
MKVRVEADPELQSSKLELEPRLRTFNALRKDAHGC